MVGGKCNIKKGGVAMEINRANKRSNLMNEAKKLAENNNLPQLVNPQ
ncbi:hypothetical protein GCM10020331_079840 [Ectobacillus funiculus]